MQANFPGAPSEKLLLVEGPDDKHVVWHIQSRLNLNIDFDIEDNQGWENLRESIPRELKVPGRRSLGILVDADTSAQSRWQAIRSALQSSEFSIPVPRDPQPGGTIIEGEIRVGVWLMPDNARAGELEDFIAEMIPAGDPVWPRAQQYINGIPAGDRKFRDRKILKAQLHAWLAAREEPRPMGSAIRTGELQVDGPLCRTFGDWLGRLFQ